MNHIKNIDLASKKGEIFWKIDTWMFSVLFALISSGVKNAMFLSNIQECRDLKTQITIIIGVHMVMRRLILICIILLVCTLNYINVSPDNHIQECRILAIICFSKKSIITSAIQCIISANHRVKGQEELPWTKLNSVICFCNIIDISSFIFLDEERRKCIYFVKYNSMLLSYT